MNHRLASDTSQNQTQEPAVVIRETLPTPRTQKSETAASPDKLFRPMRRPRGSGLVARAALSVRTNLTHPERRVQIQLHGPTKRAVTRMVYMNDKGNDIIVVRP